jgi:hypothetical protein
MPCDTIQRSTVTLELKAENTEYLLAALRSLDYNVTNLKGQLYFSNAAGLTGSFTDGKLNVTGRTAAVQAFDLNAVKRAYSLQVVKAAAKQYGWQLTPQAQNKFAVQKRGF